MFAELRFQACVSLVNARQKIIRCLPRRVLVSPASFWVDWCGNCAGVSVDVSEDNLIGFVVNGLLVVI